MLLSDAGFPVLRFDPAGCGDSAGGDEAWRVARWEDDVRTACAELRSRAGVQRVGLVTTERGARSLEPVTVLSVKLKTRKREIEIKSHEQ